MNRKLESLRAIVAVGGFPIEHRPQGPYNMLEGFMLHGRLVHVLGLWHNGLSG